jgi:thioredoxin-like negative regulator of GroEL
MENREVKDVDVADRLLREQESKLAEDPSNPRILRTLAELSLKKGDTEAALEWYGKLLATTGLNDPQILQQIRDIHLSRITSEEKALDASDPDRAAKLEEIQARRTKFLIEDARRRCEANPTDLSVRLELGELHLRAGRLGEAIAELQKAQNNPSKRIAAMNLLAQAFSLRGMNDLAAKKLEEALKEKPVFDDEAKDLRYQLGTVLEKVGRKSEAIEQFKLIYEQDIGYRDVMARVDAFYASQD